MIVVGGACGTGDSGGVEVGEEEVGSATYRLEFPADGTAEMQDGEYREPVAEGSATELVIRVLDSAFGDLDGDGGGDAAVVLVSNPGGSGSFYTLHALAASDDGPLDAASIFLGDRIRVEELEVENGGIVVTLLGRRDDEPMSAPPSRSRTHRYRLTEGELVEVERGRRGTGLLGYEWTLVEFKGPLGSEPLELPAADPPTLDFTAEPLDEGSARRLTGFGGCNRFFGGYEVSGDRLTLSPLGATRMMCRPAIMEVEDAYFAALGEARSFAIRGDELTIRSGVAELSFVRGRVAANERP